MKTARIGKHLAIGLATTFAIAASIEFIATGQDNDVTVCVGPDSILRSPASGVCPPGSRRFKLAGPDLPNADAVDQDDALGPAKKDEATLDRRLHDLAERIGNLENAALFEVVNQKGDVIFSVTPRTVQVYSENKTAVAAITASPDGGQFVARTADGGITTYLGAYRDRAGLRIAEGNYPRLDLLRQPAGNYSLRIPMGAGDIAAIGESRAGTGAIVVGDRGGNHRAALQVDGGKGAATIFNKGGQGVASLTQSANGGGLLVLANAGGTATVLMKASENNRYGVVMALPSGFPYVPKSGLPGSYMLGCAAGAACVP
jgi:hypothetical protein